MGHLSEHEYAQLGERVAKYMLYKLVLVGAVLTPAHALELVAWMLWYARTAPHTCTRPHTHTTHTCTCMHDPTPTRMHTPTRLHSTPLRLKSPTLTPAVCYCLPAISNPGGLLLPACYLLPRRSASACLLLPPPSRISVCCYMRVFLGAAKDRLDSLVVCPRAPLSQHLRVLALLLLILMQDGMGVCLLLRCLAHPPHAMPATKLLLCAFDVAVVAVDGSKTLLKYGEGGCSNMVRGGAQIW